MQAKSLDVPIVAVAKLLEILLCLQHHSDILEMILQFAFYYLMFFRDPQTKAKVGRNDHATHPGNYTYPGPSSYYTHPPMGPPPHPTVMYSVPMIPVNPGYAPWFAPPLGYGVANSDFHDGRHLGGR